MVNEMKWTFEKKRDVVVACLAIDWFLPEYALRRLIDDEDNNNSIRVYVIHDTVI